MEAIQNKKRQDRDQHSPDDLSLKRSVMMGKSKLESNEVEDEDDSKPSSSTHKALSSINKKEEVVESVQAEMGEVMEENQRLRSHLGRLMKDYEALQSRFNEIAGGQQMEEEEANDQLSLSLGRNSSIDSKNKDDDNDRKIMSGLGLALYSKQDQDQEQGGGVLVPDSSTDNNSFEGPKEDVDAHRESWPPAHKAVPATRNGGGGDADGAVQQPPVKKARVSVRARCDTPTMNDGCQWRKYGQKIAKGNPCPRAYYRCTVAPSCPVRKQVQRCVDDMSILITTYEGTHNHPLPISANAMANTTSAAAYMLTSGSSTSTNAHGTGYYTTMATTNNNSVITDLSSTLNFISSATRSRPPLLSSNINSFSTYPTSQPTITLDLTTAASSAPSTSTSDPFSRLGSTNSTTFAPRSSSYSPYPNITNLTFNSSDMSSNSHPNPNCSTLNYTSTTQVGQPPLMTVGARPGPSHQDSLFYQALLQNMRNPSPNPNPNPSHGNCQPPHPDSTVEAAARAITSDPSFQSALTAALSSLITGNSSSGSGGDSSSNSLTQKQLQK